MIVLASATGMDAPQIARALQTDESHVRKVIHAFKTIRMRYPRRQRVTRPTRRTRRSLRL